jgi:hypothetical protein
MNDTNHKVQGLDVLTGKEYEREMSAEEIAALPKASDEAAPITD